MARTRIQFARSFTQGGFFILFLLAPPLDIFRYDLTQGHFMLLGQKWMLNIDAIRQAEFSAYDAAFNVLVYGLIPVVAFATLFMFVAWRWGRLYCGWLCPHFSVVETINKLMRRASGKPSLWEKNALPQKQPDGRVQKPNPLYWLPTLAAVLIFALTWSVGLLTYLLPPFEIYSNLVHFELTRNQFIFITVATSLFCIEFTFARHLFCRYGCAVGLFQSLAWMANRRAMVIKFDTSRKASACKSCNNACDNVCPMRLQPRTIKRKMFTCTECGECISACTQVQGGDPELSLLRWVSGDAAEKLSAPPMAMPEKTSVKIPTAQRGH
ncbi:MAG: 4Fe-4S binding protein [Gammaproteobacteria bacterium]